MTRIKEGNRDLYGEKRPPQSEFNVRECWK